MTVFASVSFAEASFPSSRTPLSESLYKTLYRAVGSLSKQRSGSLPLFHAFAAVSSSAWILLLACSEERRQLRLFAGMRQNMLLKVVELYPSGRVAGHRKAPGRRVGADRNLGRNSSNVRE